MSTDTFVNLLYLSTLFDLSSMTIKKLESTRKSKCFTITPRFTFQCHNERQFDKYLEIVLYDFFFCCVSNVFMIYKSADPFN